MDFYRKRPNECRSAQIRQMEINCRSALARERGLPREIHPTDTPPSRASALLDRLCISRNFQGRPKSALADIPKPDAKPVGAGLLANAVPQPKSMAQTHSHRGQARSYTGYASDAKPVGAGLLANAVSQSKPTAQTHRLRGQARSYTGYASDAKPVGAGLLANAVSQPKPTAQKHRPRGQARSCSGPSPNRGNAVTPPAFRR